MVENKAQSDRTPAGVTQNPTNNFASDINTTELALCLAENNITVYYSSTCSACKVQMEMFDDGWNYLTKVNCSESFDICRNIKYIPTWINGSTDEMRVGVQELKDLGEWCNYL